MRILRCLALTWSVVGTVGVSAQPAASQPGLATTASVAASVAAPAAAPEAGALRATVTGIQGTAQVREAEDQPWKPARVGMVVAQGAEFRTGPRSSLTFVIPPDQTCTIDRLTTIKVLQAVSDGRKLTTDLGMQYGRTMYEIEAAGLQHDSRIVSPGATMAVRGTRIVYDDHAPFTPSMVSNEGRVQYRNLRRQVIAFGGRQRTKMSAADRAPAETARKETRLNPQGAFAAQSESEAEKDQAVTAVSGLDANGVRALAELRRLLGPGDLVGVPPVPGPLLFTLNWFASKGKPSAIDLDLRVVDPDGLVASFTNPIIGSGTSTGRHSGNDRVGPASPRRQGIEFVQWGKFFPPGTYRVEVRHVSGAPARGFIIVNRQGKDLPSPGTGVKAPFEIGQGETVTRTVVVKGPATGGSGAKPAGAKETRRGR